MAYVKYYPTRMYTAERKTRETGNPMSLNINSQQIKSTALALHPQWRIRVGIITASATYKTAANGQLAEWPHGTLCAAVIHSAAERP